MAETDLLDRARLFEGLEPKPADPLLAQGYPSIGCRPCTNPVGPGEDKRAGRNKVECGLHVDVG